MLTITGLEELRTKIGEELGVSEWHEVTQELVNAFADVTGDHQWIHTDPEKATQTPFGGTIAHGYYTLSLHPMFAQQVLRFEGFSFAVNYGLDRVRFPAPLPVGNRVRMRISLLDVEDVLGGAQIKMKFTFEGEGALKPVCVAESLTRVYS
ncbi:MAG TPA: MaoC family dehydratase [Solirubrobacteraceae bacterium]|nr:MaoC family dehydratase [Solirubrobacteraceae bacterium]